MRDSARSTSSDDSLGRVQVTGRDDMPPGLHDPRAEVRRTEAVPAPSAAGGDVIAGYGLPEEFPEVAVLRSRL